MMVSSFCYMISLMMYFFLILIFFCNLHHQTTAAEAAAAHSNNLEDFNTSTIIASSHRKLLLLHHAESSCTKRDISISQSRDLSSGIPHYIVQIVNTCVSDNCAPSNIHLHCGWFASARIVTPKTFKRLSYDDCLLNGGKPLKASQVIRFSYSNSFMYPIAFKHAKFC